MQGIFRIARVNVTPANKFPPPLLCFFMFTCLLSALYTGTQGSCEMK